MKEECLNCKEKEVIKDLKKNNIEEPYLEIGEDGYATGNLINKR